MQVQCPPDTPSTQCTELVRGNLEQSAAPGCGTLTHDIDLQTHLETWRQNTLTPPNASSQLEQGKEINMRNYQIIVTFMIPKNNFHFPRVFSEYPNLDTSW